MTPLDRSNPKIVEFSFGTLSLYTRHAEGRFNRGVDFARLESKLVINAITEHFENQSCGYISLREASYSVDPLAAQTLFNGTVIKRAAFVIKNNTGLVTFRAERIFYQIPTNAFSTLEEAERFVAEGLNEAVS